jgi:uracil-DNA glycosylase
MTAPPLASQRVRRARSRPSPAAALARVSREARACSLCAGELPHEPRPVFQVAGPAPILLTGQAPGRRVHETGIPWNDASGDRLREWLGVDRATFYDPSRFAILPMGLCYPGSDPGKGDRPPLARCAPTWQPRFYRWLAPSLRLHLLIGAYAIVHFLPECRACTLSETVRDFRRHLRDGQLPLPHPSPRNRRWLRDRPWFDRELLPVLRRAVAAALSRHASTPKASLER